MSDLLINFTSIPCVKSSSFHRVTSYNSPTTDMSKEIDASSEVQGANHQDTQRELVSDAAEANYNDHKLTIVQAFKRYPKAVAWSSVMSASCIMDGYDLKLIGSLFAQPTFQKAYGKAQPGGGYQVTAAWQSGLNNGSNVGQMIGLCFAGHLSERLGYRKTMLGTLLVIPCLIFIQFFAPNLIVLQVGQILLGELLLCTHSL
jgi:SP family general alpha glucoside:H+ symporter-like MFS transporter